LYSVCWKSVLLYTFRWCFQQNIILIGITLIIHIPTICAFSPVTGNIVGSDLTYSWKWFNLLHLRLFFHISDIFLFHAFPSTEFPLGLYFFSVVVVVKDEVFFSTDILQSPNLVLKLYLLIRVISLLREKWYPILQEQW
jgi:hypothetical protein